MQLLSVQWKFSWNDVKNYNIADHRFYFPKCCNQNPNTKNQILFHLKQFLLPVEKSEKKNTLKNKQKILKCKIFMRKTLFLIYFVDKLFTFYVKQWIFDQWKNFTSVENVDWEIGSNVIELILEEHLYIFGGIIVDFYAWNVKRKFILLFEIKKINKNNFVGI